MAQIEKRILSGSAAIHVTWNYMQEWLFLVLDLVAAYVMYEKKKKMDLGLDQKNLIGFDFEILALYKLHDSSVYTRALDGKSDEKPTGSIWFSVPVRSCTRVAVDNWGC